MSEAGQQARVFESSAVAEAYFYEAFALLDIDLMSAVWCDSDAAFCLHPGGQPLLGTSLVLASWRKMFHHAQPLVLSYQVIRKRIAGEMALHLVEERLSSADGRHRGLVMATNCYLRQGDSWHLLSHQGTSMALPDSPQVEEPAVLH
jgi:hypothetical protein